MNRKAFTFCIIWGFFSLWIGLGTAHAATHSGTLTSNETWASSDNPHYIDGNVIVPNGFILTIEPGVEVFFNGNYYIRVAGEMEAEGTSEDRILFTKDLGTTGWSQLHFYDGGTGSLSYCTIEYATYGVNLATNAACAIDHCAIQYCTNGIYYSQSAVNPGHIITNNTIRNNTSRGVYFSYVTDAMVGEGNVIKNNKAGIYFNNCPSAQVAAGNIISRNLDYGVYFGNCDQPLLLSGVSECGVGVYYESCDNIDTIDNLTFSKNSEAALKVEDCGSFGLGSNNTISGNGWPLAIDVSAFPNASSHIPASGNLRNAIQIVAGSSDKTGTWPTFAGLDYVLTGNNTIQNTGSLTLSPGTTLRGQYNIYIRVDGELNAVGTAENKILFTRYGADSWGGLRFYAGSRGAIQHACIEYGYYGIYENLTASVPISDCWFRHNTYGVYAAAGANIQVIGCKFHYNDYGVYLAAGGTATIGGPGEDLCCFEGNRTCAVENKNAFEIAAENIYWGDPAGPNHVSHPSGRGDRVSDNVDFIPYAWVCAEICECDLNNDGRCDMQDWLLFGEDWGRTDCGTPPGSGNPPNDCECDLNDDGTCDMQDWLLFGEDWGRTDCPIPYISSEGSAENLTPRVSGGPCEYRSYQGEARIISICKKELHTGYGGPSHESYEVKFSFSAEEEIKEAHGKVEGKKYTLKLTNSWYPGPRFLEKYGIEEGKSFDCDLKVIIKGTCTPVIFDFPTIDLSDYFESKR